MLGKSKCGTCEIGPAQTISLFTLLYNFFINWKIYFWRACRNVIVI